MNLAEGITQEDIKVFLQEADEQIQLLNTELLDLERDSNPETLAAIFRAAHTLKGSSGMIGYGQMAEVAHAMETLLDRLRKGTVKPSATVVDALLHSVDALEALKNEMVEPKGMSADFSSLVKQLDEAAKGQSDTIPEAAIQRRGVVVTAQDTELAQDAITRGMRPFMVRAEFRSDSPFKSVRAFQLFTALSDNGQVIRSAPDMKEIEAEQAGADFRAFVVSGLDVAALRSIVSGVQDVVASEVVEYDLAVHQTESSGNQPTGPLQLEAQSATTGVEQEHATGDKRSQASVQTVRIDVDQLDSLMNLIGELVIDRTRIEQIGKSLSLKYQGDELVDALGKTSAHVIKVVNDLQEDFMKVRMLPISTVFSSFPRMMRDMARRLNKQVDFRVSGGETEIDKTVIERIRDPLVHLLRNSLDHGLESPADRVQAEKPATGVIELSAFHEQGHIIITVKDDGKGIDGERVKASAVQKGLISKEQAAGLGASDAVDLIFLAGLSTKEQTTEVSGRGVGMDIVRSNIEAVNGFIEVKTVPGDGTTFVLRLPLTLATVKSILIRSGDTLFALPLVYVLEIVRLSSADISTVQGREVFRLRDRVIPLIDISVAIGLRQTHQNAESSFRHAVVARAGERLVGFGADALLEPMEVVVKSLGKYVGETRGITGACILGDGRVVLILDVVSLVHSAVGRGALHTAGVTGPDKNTRAGEETLPTAA